MTRTGYRLVIAAVAFSFAHHVDHVLRGGEATGWPLTGSVNAFTYSLAVYPIIATAAFLSRRGRVGPRFWRLLSSGGALFVLAVHLGPAAGDAVGDIPDGYSSPIAGIVAVSVLVAFIAVLAFTAIYEAGLARREPRSRVGTRRRLRVLAGFALASALALGANAFHADRQTRPAEITTAGAQLVELPGGDLQVTDEGPRRRGRDATPIVLVHCYTCSLRWWDRVVPLLSDRHRVIRVDLLGSGGSEKPRSSYSVPEQARLLAFALDRLGVKRPIVVGHSSGFDVAVALAERTRLRGLVNLGEAPDNYLLDLPAIAKLSYLPVVGEALGRIAPSSAIKDGYAEVFAPGYDIGRGFENPDQVVEDFRAMTNTSFERSHHEQEAFVEDRPLDERAAAAGASLLVIFGARDQTWKDPRQAARGYRSVPRARIEILPGAGHSPNVEQPERVARLIGAFARNTAL